MIRSLSPAPCLLTEAAHTNLWMGSQALFRRRPKAKRNHRHGVVVVGSPRKHHKSAQIEQRKSYLLTSHKKFPSIPEIWLHRLINCDA